MGRSPCCSQVGLRKGPWSTEEDYLLTSYIQLRGEGQWRSVPKNAGLLRCGKSCRLRWLNYLRPGIKRGNISEDEEDLIVRLHKILGNRWSLIAGRLPGRTDNEIKNHWNTHLLKKLKNAGVDEDLLKPTKTKQPVASAAPTDKKKKKKKKKKVATTISNNDINPTPKTKVYRPKAIRVSPLFLGTSNSHDSLASETSINNGGDAAKKVVSYMQVALSPLFELEDANYYGVHGGGSGQEDDFMGDGRLLPVLHHSDPTSCDVNMLQKVYDEYLQLL